MNRPLHKIFTIILISLLSASFAQAQEAKKLTLDEAIKLGASNNLDIKSAKLNVTIAKNSVKTANRLQNPDINIFYNFGSAGHGNPQQIGLTEDIEILKRGARKKLAKSNLLLTKQNVEFAQFDTRMDIREAYVNLVAQKAILKALEDQQKLLNDLLYIAKKRFEAGASPEMDVIQARIAMNEMVTQVNSAKVNVKSARFEFNKALNVKDKDLSELYDSAEDTLPSQIKGGTFISMFTPEPKKKVPLFGEVSQEALNKRYDVQIAKQQIDTAKKNLTVVSRQRIPDLTLLGGYGYQTAGSSGEGRFLNGAYLGGALTNIPLLYTYRPEIKSAKLQVEQAKLNYDSVQNKAEKDLSKAYEKFVTAKLNLNYYNENLIKDSDEMIRISKRSYEVGKSNLTSLIVMEQSYKSIIVGYTQALASYYTCWIDFLREVNNEEFTLVEENI